MNSNFNSNTSEAYSLHVSNDHIEMNLPPNALSSASNFEVNLSPALDLNQLSYLQSTDVEVSYRRITFPVLTSQLALIFTSPPLLNSKQSLVFFLFSFRRG